MGAISPNVVGSPCLGIVEHWGLSILNASPNLLFPFFVDNLPVPKVVQWFLELRLFIRTYYMREYGRQRGCGGIRRLEALPAEKQSKGRTGGGHTPAEALPGNGGGRVRR